MRTLTLLFYAAATFLLGAIATPFAHQFAGAAGIDVLASLVPAVSLAVPVVFVTMAVVAAIIPPGEARADRPEAAAADAAVESFLDRLVGR